MLNLKEFLVGEKNLVVDYKEGRPYHNGLARIVDTDNNIDYVFKDSFAKKTIFNPFSIKENSILGIYCRNTGIFYFVSDVEKKYSRVDYSDIENYCIDTDIQKNLIESVNNSIISKVGNNKNLVYVDLEEKDYPTKETIFSTAKRIFAKEDSIDDFSYADFDIRDIYTEIDLIVNYIKDKESTIERLSDEFIEKHRKSIYITILTNEEVSKALESLNNDERYMKLREFNKIFSRDDIKTINILYKKDGKEMKLKIKNSIFLSDLDAKISTYKIIDKKDARKFEEEFKNSRGFAFIEPEYIEKITYGKKVLYQK